jgi:hypothetical protein
MRQDDEWLDEWLQGLGAGSAEVHRPTDATLATFDVVTDTLGRSHRAVKLPCDKFRHTVHVPEALAAAHPDILDLQTCVQSGVLCTRNCTVDQFNDLALKAKEEAERQRGTQLHPIQVLRGDTKVKGANGADALDDDMLTEEFLQMCEAPGMFAQLDRRWNASDGAECLSTYNHDVVTGVPPHQLRLSVGCVAMVTRNLDAKFQNGTRVIITRIGNKTVEVLDAAVYDPELPLHHAYQPGDKAIIPRILFDWKHRRIGLTIQRRQFPLRLAYAVTFNKSQGKTLKNVVIDIRNQPFAHGQLYVACSRVRNRQDITILCSPQNVHYAQNGEPEFVVAVNVVERCALLESLPLHLQQEFLDRFPLQ